MDVEQSANVLLTAKEEEIILSHIFYISRNFGMNMSLHDVLCIVKKYLKSTGRPSFDCTDKWGESFLDRHALVFKDRIEIRPQTSDENTIMIRNCLAGARLPKDYETSKAYLEESMVKLYAGRGCGGPKVRLRDAEVRQEASKSKRTYHYRTERTNVQTKYETSKVIPQSVSCKQYFRNNDDAPQCKTGARLLAPCKCKFNCRDKITEERRQTIFKLYREMVYELRFNWMLQYITRNPVKRRTAQTKHDEHHVKEFTLQYYLPTVDGVVKVCKTLFLHTLGYSTDKTLRKLMVKAKMP